MIPIRRFFRVVFVIRPSDTSPTVTALLFGLQNPARCRLAVEGKVVAEIIGFCGGIVVSLPEIVPMDRLVERKEFATDFLVESVSIGDWQALEADGHKTNAALDVHCHT